MRVAVIAGLVVCLIVLAVVLGVGRASAAPKTFADAKALMGKAGFFRIQGNGQPIPKQDQQGWPALFLKHCDVPITGTLHHPEDGETFGWVCDSHANAIAAAALLEKRAPQHHPGEEWVTNNNLLFAVDARTQQIADRWARILDGSA